MNRLRLLTSGESHGPALTGILEGLPARLRIDTEQVNHELWRRQQGYGSGKRMEIEKDQVRWTAGLRYGATLGSPVGFEIANLDWPAWEKRMSPEPVPIADQPKAITRVRPGHADLAGAVKYDTVIGTIGNTHGVSSDRKPISAASAIAAHSACQPGRPQPHGLGHAGWPSAETCQTGTSKGSSLSGWSGCSP